MLEYIKARWDEVSTRIGIVLSTLSAVIPAYVSINPHLIYVGLAASVLLMLWPENKNAAD